MSVLSCSRFAIVLAISITLSITMHGQIVQDTESRPGKLIGTVTDVNGDPVANATVTLETPESDNRRTLATPENGFFEFNDLKPATSYQVNITARGFAEWTSPAITLGPGQFKIVTGIQLRIATEHTTVDVHYDPVEVATEQFKSEEQQRAFGIIPNFYVSYESDPAPLTAKRNLSSPLRSPSIRLPPPESGWFLLPSKPETLRIMARVGALMECGLGPLLPMAFPTS